MSVTSFSVTCLDMPTLKFRHNTPWHVEPLNGSVLLILMWLQRRKCWPKTWNQCRGTHEGGYTWGLRLAKPKKLQQQKQLKLKQHHLPTIQITRNHPHKIKPARLALKGTVLFFPRKWWCCLLTQSLLSIYYFSLLKKFNFHTFLSIHRRQSLVRSQNLIVQSSRVYSLV
jgi:hypothetical protein